MKKYIYKIKQIGHIDNQVHQDYLNAQGELGWELVAVTTSSFAICTYQYFFKKEVQE